MTVISYPMTVISYLMTVISYLMYLHDPFFLSVCKVLRQNSQTVLLTAGLSRRGQGEGPSQEQVQVKQEPNLEWIK